MNPKLDKLAKHVWIGTKSPMLVFYDATSTVDDHDLNDFKLALEMDLEYKKYPDVMLQI